MKPGKKKTKNTVKPKRKRGRPPTDWKPAQEALCYLIANSNMGWRSCLKELAKTLKPVPSVMTVDRWFIDDKEFCERYARAKEEQADFLAEEILTNADDSSEDEIFIECEDGSGQSAKRVCNKEFIARSRLRVDTRKWIASKLKPKKYGEKVDVTSGNEPLQQVPALSPIEAASRIAYLLMLGVEAKKKQEAIEHKPE